MKYITNARLLTLGLSLFLGTFLSAQDNTVFDKKQFEQNLQKAQELTAENKMKEAMVYLEKADKTMYSKNAAHPIEATKLTLAFGDWYLSNGNIKTAEDTYKWSLLSAESVTNVDTASETTVSFDGALVTFNEGTVDSSYFKY